MRRRRAYRQAYQRAWQAPTAPAAADGPAPVRRAMPRAVPETPERASGGNACERLFQLDIVVDGMRQVDAVDRQRHLGRQRFIALELAARHRRAHGLLDLTLGGDA